MNRKSFLTKIGAASTFLAGIPVIGNSKARSKTFELEYEKKENRTFGANEQINIALIGAGGMGQGNGLSAMRHNGIRMVAACDLYDSRLVRCKERWGQDLFTTRDYREILERNDVDAVIISSSDHWHDIQAIDSLNKGKAVFLEKPMVQHVEQAYDVIRAEKESGSVLQIGSQFTSSIVYQKVRDLLNSGEIGELNVMEGTRDRYSAQGAWQYSIPPGVSTDEVDWNTIRNIIPTHLLEWLNHRNSYTMLLMGMTCALITSETFLMQFATTNRSCRTGPSV